MILIHLCLSLLLCSPAMAQHTGPYVGAFIGGNALMDAKSSDRLGEFNLTYKPDLSGSAVLGWEFGPGNPVGQGRIELEYSRRNNQLDKIEFVEGSFNGGGDMKSDSLLVNFLGVYPDGDKKRWVPYFGVGIGVARIEASSLMVSGQPLATGSDTVLAYQLGAGLDYALTNNLILDFGYRFFNSIRPELTEINGLKFKMDYLSHSLVFGLRVGF